MSGAAASGVAGKVAVVTGAASGIGLAVARHLVAAGARTLLVDRDDIVEEAAAGLGDHAAAMVADVTEDGSAARFVAEAERRFGPVGLAMLTAGITGPIARLDTVPVDAFDAVMAVNVRDVWLGLAALLPAMRRNGGGSIVATSSTAGLRGAARLAAYSASKHAVIGLVKSAALEGARDGIRVNAVCPGPIDTGMIAGIEEAFRPGDPDGARRGTAGRVPLGRLGTVDDVAAMALFLLGDGGAFTTGGAHTIDGGVMAGLPG